MQYDDCTQFLISAMSIREEISDKINAQAALSKDVKSLEHQLKTFCAAYREKNNSSLKLKDMDGVIFYHPQKGQTFQVILKEGMLVFKSVNTVGFDNAPNVNH